MLGIVADAWAAARRLHRTSKEYRRQQRLAERAAEAQEHAEEVLERLERAGLIRPKPQR